MTYTRTTWADFEVGGTPTDAANFNNMEVGIVNAVPVWLPGTPYTVGYRVVSPNNDVVSATATHTSGSTYNPANWTLSSTFLASDEKAAASGLASLDSGTKVPIAQIPTGTSSTTVTIGNDSRVTGAVQSSIATAKGDIFVATASGTPGRQAVGPDGKILVADSTQPTGLNWLTGSGIVPGGWNAITSFGASVSAGSGATYYAPACRLSADGTKVELRGELVLSASPANGDTVFTLPSATFYPAKKVGISGVSDSGAFSSANARMLISNTGVATSLGTMGNGAGSVFLDGISFVLAV